MLVNGKEQAGIYAQGFRIIEILSNYGYLFTVILLPVFSKMIKQNESVQNLTRLSFTLLIVPALIVVFGCISYRNEIIDILYIRHVQDSASVFAILTLSFLGICITYIFGTLLTANGNLSILNTMAAIAVVINITLNLIFIRKFGIIGAAIANACTQVFTGVFQIIMVKRIFRFKTDRRLIVSLALFIILIAAASVLFRYIHITWFYSFFLYVLFSLVLSFPLGLMKIKDFSALLLSEK
jgi:O-antigen/teichoic acid export membrane protein